MIKRKKEREFNCVHVFCFNLFLINVVFVQQFGLAFLLVNRHLIDHRAISMFHRYHSPNNHVEYSLIYSNRQLNLED